VDTLARLREIVRGSGSARRPSAVPARERTNEPVGADGLPPERASATGPLEGARRLTTPYGEALVVERTLEAGAPHGLARVEEGDLVDREALAVLTGRPVPEAGVKPSPVYFDLETTGLSGGAGTVAFLIGCGWYEAGAFHTRQFFLPGFAAERALLHAVGEFLDGVPLLVTYNGRTFDLPIMETRWSLHRMPAAADGVPHVDMLPPARRLWREALDGEARSCRLVALEASLLGFVRTGDVPGWEIPQRYFDYVRRGDGSALEPVLHHNRLDLLSLAVLAARAQRLVREGASASRDARECCALGQLLGRAGRTAEAEAAYRAATDHPAGDPATRQQAWRALALLLRRERRHHEAAAAWRHVLASGQGGPASEAVEALAIHHEHRERDLDLAHALAVRALRSEFDPRRRAAVRHRLARLERKLGAGGGRRPAGGVLLDRAVPPAGIDQDRER
jgi:hypothetical protein